MKKKNSTLTVYKAAVLLLQALCLLERLCIVGVLGEVLLRLFVHAVMHGIQQRFDRIASCA